MNLLNKDDAGKPKKTAKKKKNQPAQTPADDGHYVVYARKWRPQTFDEVVGQKHVSEALKNAIKNRRISHAYLFTGPRGIGKTSMARILSKALNCQSADQPVPTPCGKCDQCRSIAVGSNLDVIEIDGASNNRVDEIRELREAVGYTPFAGRYKVYIIDEVHMLSLGAFNALLKTLEEPPPRIVFILATTEQHKIPATIISRCQPFEFHPISTSDIVQRLEFILEQEKIEVDKNERQAILETIANFAEGGMRDAQVALDQAITLSEGKLNLSGVRDLLGLVDHTVCGQIIEGIQKSDVASLLNLVDQLVAQGRDLFRLVKQLMQFVRDLMIMKTTSAATRLVTCPEDQRKEMERLLGIVEMPLLLNLSHRLVELETQMKGAAPQRFLLELALIQLASLSDVQDIGGMLREIQELKTQLATGQVPRDSASAKPASSGRHAFHDVSSEMNSEPMPSSPAVSSASAPKPSASMDIQNANSVWQALLDELNHKRPVLSMRLSKFRLLHLDEGTLEIGIPDTDQALAVKEQILEKQENHRLLAQTIKKLTGHHPAIRYRIVAGEDMPPQPEEATSIPVEDKVAASKLTESPKSDKPSGAEAEIEAEMERRQAQYMETFTDPEKRVRDILKNHPDFREQLQNALNTLGGGSIVRIDGVPLPRGIRKI